MNTRTKIRTASKRIVEIMIGSYYPLDRLRLGIDAFRNNPGRQGGAPDVSP